MAASADIERIERQLVAEAERAAGLADWGADASFRNGLEVYIEDMRALPPAQADALRATLVALLVQRLTLIEDARRHPEIRDHKP